MTLQALTLQQVSACQLKRSGSAPAEREQQRRYTSRGHAPAAATVLCIFIILLGLKGMLLIAPTTLAAKTPMGLAFTTCQAMWLSGAMIGTALSITKQVYFFTITRFILRTQLDLRQVGNACCAAADGTTPPTSAARRPVAAAVPAVAAATTASVSRGLRSSLYPC